MPEKDFDAQCIALAEAFLHGTLHDNPEAVAELASLLQETMDDFLEEIEEVEDE